VAGGRGGDLAGEVAVRNLRMEQGRSEGEERSQEPGCTTEPHDSKFYSSGGLSARLLGSPGRRLFSATCTPLSPLT